MVLLQPQVPNPDELVTRFLPALDRFLASSSINVHEQVDVTTDPRKHSFVAQARDARQAFVEELVAVVSLSRQFGDALSALLDSQRAVRAVSNDEHIIKAMWMHDRFARLLENMLEKTRKQIVALQKNFLSVYNDNAAARASRLQPVLHMEEEVWRADRQLNSNFAAKAKQSAKVKRKPVEALDDNDSWLQECHAADPPSGAFPKMTGHLPPLPPLLQNTVPARSLVPPRMNAAGEGPLARRSSSEEDGSSELMQHTIRAAAVAAASSLPAESAVPPKRARLEPDVAAAEPSVVSQTLPVLMDDDDLCLGPIGMVTFDEEDFFGELVF